MRAALRAEGGGGGDHLRYVMDRMMDGKERSTTSKSLQACSRQHPSTSFRLLLASYRIDLCGATYVVPSIVTTSIRISMKIAYKYDRSHNAL